MKLSAILTACLASFAIANVAVSSTDAARSTFKSPTICDPSVKQVSGYIDAASDRHYFFWLFEARHQDPGNAPLILYFNGGPGVSSLTAMLMENGPCRMSANDTEPVFNPYSINDRAHVIYVDVPPNTGFSNGTNTFNSMDIGADMDRFMHKFYTKFPKYRASKLHIFGESFAAHFVTASGHAMRNRPQLESISIGNGVVAPYHHSESYAKMACNSTYGPVLPTEQCQQLDHIFQTECKPTIARCYQTLTKDDCNTAFNRCWRPQLGLFYRSGVNSYDVRIKCEEGYLCYPVYNTIEKYFNKPDVQAALGVNQKFQKINMDVYAGYYESGEWMSPAYLRLIPGLLRKGVRVLVYAGDADFVYNWYGTKAWVKDLDWHNKPAFNAVPDRAWSVDGKAAGEVRSAELLTFARIFGGSHTPSYDQPRPFQALTNRWLSNQPIV